MKITNWGYQAKTLAKYPLSSILTTAMTQTTESTITPFAVIETGGKQYKVIVGDTITVELLSDKKEGDTVTFENVLLADTGKETKVGTPYIKGSKVTATHLGEIKGKKLSIVRFKAKSNRSRKIGHRQQYAQVRIDSIA